MPFGKKYGGWDNDRGLFAGSDSALEYQIVIVSFDASRGGSFGSVVGGSVGEIETVSAAGFSVRCLRRKKYISAPTGMPSLTVKPSRSGAALTLERSQSSAKPKRIPEFS